MKKTVCNFIQKKKWLALYGLFGIGTIAVNFFIYHICSDYFFFSTMKSNFYAWLIAVIFAYVTNRKWVFGSEKSSLKDICKECISFISCRLVTGIVDIFLMVFLVDGLHLYDMAVKGLTNFIVIVMNLVLCKNLIFKSEIDALDYIEDISFTDKYIN